jgi:hypothetical protein
MKKKYQKNNSNNSAKKILGFNPPTSAPVTNPDTPSNSPILAPTIAPSFAGSFQPQPPSINTNLPTKQPHNALPGNDNTTVIVASVFGGVFGFLLVALGLRWCRARLGSFLGRLNCFSPGDINQDEEGEGVSVVDWSEHHLSELNKKRSLENQSYAKISQQADSGHDSDELFEIKFNNHDQEEELDQAIGIMRSPPTLLSQASGAVDALMGRKSTNAKNLKESSNNTFRDEGIRL